jgi:hypothetical protein
MAPCCSQAWIIGPKVACFSNQARKRGLERPKAAAAKMRNGVVGSSGRTTPSAPTATQKQPKVSHTNRSAERSDGWSMGGIAMPADVPECDMVRSRSVDAVCPSKHSRLLVSLAKSQIVVIYLQIFAF